MFMTQRCRRHSLGAGVVALAVTGALLGTAEASPSAAAPKAAETTTIIGSLSYLNDRIPDRLMPARSVRVAAVRIDGSGTGTVVERTYSSDWGSYRLEVPAVGSDGTPLRYRLRVSTVGPEAQVRIAEGSAKGVPFGWQSPIWTAEAGTTRVVDKHFANDVPGDVERPNERSDWIRSAFSVLDALTTGTRYAAEIGHPAPARIGLKPPGPSDAAAIGYDDALDWDVILHEYGHQFAAHHGLSQVWQSVGHTPGRNTTDEFDYTKNEGLHIAWGEGIATWFGVQLQQTMGIAELGIPGAGDDYYDDGSRLAPSSSLRMPLGASTSPASAGEDEELSTARTLWSYTHDQELGVNDAALLDALIGAAPRPQTLHAATPVLLRAAGADPFDDSGSVTPEGQARSDTAACNLTAQRVAPLITSPATPPLRQDVPPEIAWEVNGAGPKYPLNTFTVQFWLPDRSRMIAETEQVDALAPNSSTPMRHTVDAELWKQVMAEEVDGEPLESVYVVIKAWGDPQGNPLTEPVTGPYKSCAVEATIARPVLTTSVTDDLLRPPNARGACSPRLGPLPGDDRFTLNGRLLAPSAEYGLALHLDSGAAPDVDLGTVTTSERGEIVDHVVQLPQIAASERWLLVATPPKDAEPTEVERPVVALSCAFIEYTETGDGTTDWGFLGLAPQGSATMDIASSRPPQHFQTTADGQGVAARTDATWCLGPIDLTLLGAGVDARWQEIGRLNCDDFGVTARTGERTVRYVGVAQAR